MSTRRSQRTAEPDVTPVDIRRSCSTRGPSPADRGWGSAAKSSTSLALQLRRGLRTPLGLTRAGSGLGCGRDECDQYYGFDLGDEVVAVYSPNGAAPINPHRERLVTQATVHDPSGESRTCCYHIVHGLAGPAFRDRARVGAGADARPHDGCRYRHFTLSTLLCAVPLLVSP